MNSAAKSKKNGMSTYEDQADKSKEDGINTYQELTDSLEAVFKAAGSPAEEDHGTGKGCDGRVHSRRGAVRER